MRGKSTSTKDKKKVIKAKLNNPEISLRDIEKETWINYQNAKNIIDDIPELLTTFDKEKKMIDDKKELVKKLTIE